MRADCVAWRPTGGESPPAFVSPLHADQPFAPANRRHPDRRTLRVRVGGTGSRVRRGRQAERQEADDGL